MCTTATTDRVVVDIARKPVEAPDEQSGFGGPLAEIDHHLLESIPAFGRGARSSIDKDLGEGIAMLLAPETHDLFLLLRAEFLGIAT